MALAETGNRTEAAKAAGISRWTPYDPQWRDDKALQAALRLADEAAADLIESEVYRRAVHGWEEPVGWYMGQAGGMVRKYSDVLAIFLLKGLRPEKYRDRMELRGAFASLDVSQLPDELVARLARGEHPASVLSGWAEGAKALGAGAVESGSSGRAHRAHYEEGDPPAHRTGQPPRAGPGGPTPNDPS